MMLSSEDHSSAAKLVREILIGDFLPEEIEADAQSGRLNLSYERIASALEKALENPDTNDFDAGLGIAATMLRKGEHLPNWLALFAADVLEGKCRRPTNRGPDRYANWIRNYKLARAVVEVSNQFDLPKYSNSDTSHKITAAEIAAESGHISLDVVLHATKLFGGDINRITSLQSSTD